jgi:hypothetical protein
MQPGTALVSGSAPSSCHPQPHWDIRFVLIVATALSVFTSIPYLLAEVLPFQGSRFQGFLSFGPDFNAYYAFMRQAQEGSWLFHNPFTPEPHSPVFLNLEWLLMGRFAGLTGMSLEASVQTFRVVSIFGLCAAFSYLASFVIQSTFARRVSFLMAMLGGGLGWLLTIPALDAPGRWGNFLDLYAGVHPFFWMMIQPHWLVTQMLALVALGLFLNAERTRSMRLYIACGACCVAVGAMRPWDMICVCSGIALFAAVMFRREVQDWKRSLPRLIPVVMPVPLLLYYLWLFRIDPIFRWFYLQNISRAPSSLSLALSMGAAAGLSVVALAAALFCWRQKRPGEVLILLCTVSSLVLMSCWPLISNTWQFHQTVLIPAVLAGIAAIEQPLKRLSCRQWAYTVTGVLLVVNALTSIKLEHQYVSEVIAGYERVPEHRIAAYRWLQQNSRPRDVVLASFSISNEIPRYTHATVFSGYAMTTVNFAGKDAQVKRFYDAATDDAWRRSVLTKYAIRYVFFAADGHRSGRVFDPAESPFLRKAYANQMINIYEVLDLSAISKTSRLRP